MSRYQRGSTLIEVLIALLIMSIGLLGAAAIQLNALKFTDSSNLRTQASFFAYDMLDRIRANPNGAYALDNIGAAPKNGPYLSVPVSQDLFDFAQNVASLPSGGASIKKTNFEFTITITWSDTRAAASLNSQGAASGESATQTFALTSRVAADAVAP